MQELRLVDRRWHEKYSVQRLSDFVARCREQGIIVTPQRLAVIEALLASEEHPSSDQICTAVRRRNPYVSLATVHRIHDVARYDGNVEPHHHVLCVRCRRVHDVEIPDVDKLLEGATSLGPFSLLRCSVEIEALCRECQRAEKRTHARREEKRKDSRKTK